VRVLAFRHSPSDGLGWIADALDENAVSYRYADLYAPSGISPPVDEADALIFLGGAMSANDALPFIAREIAYIRSAVRRGKPVLGVCLGAQMIAKALGARVYPNDVKEIGWAPVVFTDASLHDPLFIDLAKPEVLFHWHGETFDLPAGAELLASSAACTNQAFRAGDRIYGLQFHLEVTPSMIVEWCLEDGVCGGEREIGRPIDPHAHAARAKELAATIFGRWCGLAKRQICASAAP